MLTFAMSLMILLVFKRSTKVSEKSDITHPHSCFMTCKQISLISVLVPSLLNHKA